MTDRKQLLRSATSVGANCRGESAADVIAKLAIVDEEADEGIYWLEMITETGLLPSTRFTELVDKFHQITAMIGTSQKTLRRNNPKSKTQNRK